MKPFETRNNTTTKRSAALILAPLMLTHTVGATSENFDGCAAEAYKKCSAFRMNRAIQDFTPLMDSSNYTRSKGSWKIFIGYGPPETCAKVTLYLDVGPFETDRKYERVFQGGGGIIDDRGTFLHETGNVESGLRIHNGTCLVADPGSAKLEADADERRELDAERERLALEEERERLALEEERERQAFEAEREQIAMEAQRQRREEEARLAEIRREREAKRARQQLAEAKRAAQQRRQWAEQQARMRQAELERARERRRVEEEQAAAQSSGSMWGVAPAIGFALGLSGNADAANSVLNALEQIETMRESTATESASAATVSGSCAQAQRRIEQHMRRAQDSQSGGGLCNTARHYVSTLQTVRRELASGGCPAQALRSYDQAINQARETVRSSCN